MASNTCWIFGLVALAIVIQSGAALRCWTCTSDRNPECGDPMNITDHHRNFHTRDCESSASPSAYAYTNERSICKKLVQRENGRLVVRRSCEIPSPEERDITNGPCASHDTTTQSHVTVVSCHICNTDLCNSATSLSGSRIFFITAIVTLMSLFVPAVKSSFF